MGWVSKKRYRSLTKLTHCFMQSFVPLSRTQRQRTPSTPGLLSISCFIWVCLFGRLPPFCEWFSLNTRRTPTIVRFLGGGTLEQDTPIYVHLHIYIYIYIIIYVWVCHVQGDPPKQKKRVGFTYLYKHTSTKIYGNTYTYICMYIYIHIYIHIYIYM